VAGDSDLKSTPRSFTRDGPLSPDFLVVLLLYLISDAGRRGYDLLLESFWEHARESGVPLPQEDPVSGSAFCQARKRLRHEALAQLLDRVVELHDELNGEEYRFKGRRVLAVDGCKYTVRRSDENFEEFGNAKGGHNPQATMSVLFDVIAQMPVSATITKYGTCERTELLKLSEHMKPGDICVLDRGYPSREVFSRLTSLDVDVVIGMPFDQGGAVESFYESGDKEAIVDLYDSPSARQSGRSSTRMRLVRREGDGTGPRVLATTLHKSDFSVGEICELYRFRWDLEMAYRMMKSDALGQGQLHSKSPEGVRQELYAHLLLMAITRKLMAASATRHDVPFAEIPEKRALLQMGKVILGLLMQSDMQAVDRDLDELLSFFVRRRRKPRPGRHSPRISYKPRLRWGANGRIGKA